ncbi:MAG: hypothetical protein ABJH98_17070 [Reichenbachiella sp.]|uniref:tetratricopeptide repeat protein n=1 Tax=Reichenbachiella sp. TaxID=2184521 RepID=UPI003296EBF8
MKYYSILFFLTTQFLFCFNSQSQSDSLVLLNDLAFTTEYEREQYCKLLAGEEVIFEALMAINLESNPETVALDKMMFTNEIGQLKQIDRPISESGKIKYYKEVYNHVHDRFFRKYELHHYFNKVFADGTYNCVSGCAIYALTFRELDINYFIKETPTHVYIVLESDGNQYLIETTDPSGRFNKFSKNFKTQFVKQLQSVKLIDEQEFRDSSVDDLFDKYYFTDVNLSLKELVGVQYWNDGIYKFQEEDLSGAIDAFKKCFVLYPNEKVKEMLLASLALMTNKTNYSSIADVRLISNLSRYSEDEISDVELKNEFLRLTNYQLVEKYDIVLYEKSYDFLLNNIKREAFKNEMSFVYNYERARLLHNRGRHRTAINFAEIAFDLKPKNIDAESLFLSTLGQYLQFSKDRSESYAMLDNLVQDHPELLENNKFGGLFLNMNLIRMADSYKENKKADGDLLKEKFELMYSENPYFQVDDQLIGHAYSQLAVYHFKRGQYSTAKKVLQKGMTYAPYNQELRSRMRAVNY